MASSSVSQDDIDNDFEKNSRRSRIRTARARQINPSGCRLESNIQDQNDLEIGEENSAPNYPSTSSRGAEAGASNNKYDKLVAATDESVEHETSPKPIVRGKEKRPNKMHHGNKGKQQRDRADEDGVEMAGRGSERRRRPHGPAIDWPAWQPTVMKNGLRPALL